MYNKRFTKKAKRRTIFNKMIIVSVIFAVLLIYPITVAAQITSKKYDFSNVYKIVTQGLKKRILDNDYSETLNIALKDSNFDKQRVDEYFAIDYFDKENFISSVNALLSLGYTVNEINLINKKLPDETIDALQKKDKIEDILKYLEFDFFKGENFDRYLNYHNGDYKQTLIKVNLGLDKPPNTDVKILKEFSVTMLVYNNYRKLDENFVVPDLVKIKDEYFLDGGQFLQREAAEAFEKLCVDAKIEGKYFLSRDAYRSYEDQVDTNKRFFDLFGQAYIDKFVSLPGFSEHQIGLAIDFAARGYSFFSKSSEYKWLLENAHKYGFLNTYKSELWHYRYVGIDIATYVYENNITFEEYYAMFLDN